MTRDEIIADLRSWLMLRTDVRFAAADLLEADGAFLSGMEKARTTVVDGIVYVEANAVLSVIDAACGPAPGSDGEVATREQALALGDERE